MKLARRSLAALCLISVFLTPSAFGSKRRRHHSPAWGVPEIFSSLFLEGETGDVGGMEVIIVPADRDWVVVVTASGIAYDPVLVELGGDQSTVEFTLPDTGPGS